VTGRPHITLFDVKKDDIVAICFETAITKTVTDIIVIVRVSEILSFLL